MNALAPSELASHTLIGRGESADVYHMADGNVLKLYRGDVAAGVAQREIDGAARAWQAGLLVARPLGLTSVGGRDAILFERLDGEPAVSRNWFDLPGIRAALRDLARYQVAIHATEVGDFRHRQQDILAARIATSTAPGRLKAAARALHQSLPAGSRLCHGDFHPGNAIRTARGIAAIDWSNACSGSPAADVARTELLIRYGRYGPLLRRYRVLSLLRHLAASFYVRCYCALSDLDPAEIALWRLPVAVAWLQGRSTADERGLLAIL